jgi:hypothetical protein
VEITLKETCGFLSAKERPRCKKELLRYVMHKAEFTIILPFAVDAINFLVHSPLMRCVITSFSNLWPYYLLQISMETEHWNGIPEGEKLTQDIDREAMGHDECEIIENNRRRC